MASLDALVHGYLRSVAPDLAKKFAKAVKLDEVTAFVLLAVSV
jgi:hypothetical protein